MIAPRMPAARNTHQVPFLRAPHAAIWFRSRKKTQPDSLIPPPFSPERS